MYLKSMIAPMISCFPPDSHWKVHFLSRASNLLLLYVKHFCGIVGRKKGFRMHRSWVWAPVSAKCFKNFMLIISAKIYFLWKMSTEWTGNGFESENQQYFLTFYAKNLYQNSFFSILRPMSCAVPGFFIYVLDWVYVKTMKWLPFCPNITYYYLSNLWHKMPNWFLDN